MSRHCGEVQTGPILDAAARWRDVALLGDGSVFSGKELWTRQGLEALDEHFVRNTEEGEGTYLAQLKGYLAPTAPSVKQLAAEMSWLMVLCPSNISASNKRESVEEIWSWSNEELPATAQPFLTDVVLGGIGSAGRAFNTLRWRELVFCINTCLALKKLAFEKRRELLKDPEGFAKWLENISEEGRRQLRHMLLYLLFPDNFERIFGGGDRRLVVQHFLGKSRAETHALSALQIDHAFAQIRAEQQKNNPGLEVDFYTSPLKEQWQARGFTQHTADIEKEHVIAALKEIDRTSVPKNAESTGYDLIYEGNRYPPKLVLSLASKQATGQEFDRGLFAGGVASSAFSLLRTLGFVIEPKQNVVLNAYEGAPYTVEKAADGLFVSAERLTEIVATFAHKKNLILQGPPGVGKTFFAKRVASALMGVDAPTRIEMVQFHPSYAYEDFVQGFRPTGSGFALHDGVFYKFCEKAGKEPDSNFVFIIDEINRGNLGKIFGELLMLVEADKRDPEWAVPLTYSRDSGQRFFVPANVYVLGLMNTADRSLAMVDYALRRRFAFISLEPGFETPQFAAYMREAGASDELVRRVVADMRALNDEIGGDRANLGPGFCIGHSFFCGRLDGGSMSLDWYRGVIKGEIVPLLREYWFDNADKAEAWEKRLTEG